METMPAPVVDPAVVMRLSRRRAIEFTVVFVFFLEVWGFLAIPALEPLEQAGPADYGLPLDRVILNIVLGVAFFVPGVWGLRRQQAVLQPTGPRPGVGWDQVTEIVVVSSFITNGVRLRLRSGRTLRLGLPSGSPWRHDRPFRVEVEFVRAYAVAHGAVLGPVRSRRFRTLLISLIPLLVIAAIIAARVAQRGAIWPWSPVASAPPACPALAPGLDATWPPPQRRLLVDDPASCAWESIASDSPYLATSVTITTEPGGVLASPVSRANQTYLDDAGDAVGAVTEARSQGGKASFRTLLGVGDEAFVRTSGPDDVAEARMANILVVVNLTRRGEQTGAAEEILRHLVAQIRVE